MEEFKALTDLKHLQRIDAEGCNFEDEEHVSTIFAMFPEGQMQNVDGYNEKGEEVYRTRRTIQKTKKMKKKTETTKRTI